METRQFLRSQSNPASLRKGYFDSEFVKSQLGIAWAVIRRFWGGLFAIAERYRFDPSIFEGSQIRDEYLQNLLPLKEGDEYESKDRRN